MWLVVIMVEKRAEGREGGREGLREGGVRQARVLQLDFF